MMSRFVALRNHQHSEIVLRVLATGSYSRGLFQVACGNAIGFDVLHQSVLVLALLQHSVPVGLSGIEMVVDHLVVK